MRCLLTAATIATAATLLNAQTPPAVVAKDVTVLGFRLHYLEAGARRAGRAAARPRRRRIPLDAEHRAAREGLSRLRARSDRLWPVGQAAGELPHRHAGRVPRRLSEGDRAAESVAGGQLDGRRRRALHGRPLSGYGRPHRTRRRRRLPIAGCGAARSPNCGRPAAASAAECGDTRGDAGVFKTASFTTRAS